MSDKDAGKDGEDPTADFLAEVRPEETPWRTERPPGEEAPERAERPEKWGRAKSAGRAAAKAAPYVQAAALATWIVSGTLDDSGDSGFDMGSSGDA
ncbi:hypothetical protein DMH03_17055 [Amycolatopsis sp. WAC 01376]|uniref:hypothetical protein n=1 Tax=Amycolatopsis sp. WAC 01376 TaxID=2203195 RepID=UPI000F785983|nr:hypothetical protein [Amycolatopsis sp. WAC 01376]RSM60466.1 hypothetical protein DMH03_17055 [Amycolatopsis sp. WAC 01376]